MVVFAENSSDMLNDSNWTEPLMYTMELSTDAKILDTLKSPIDVITFFLSIIGLFANSSLILATTRIPQNSTYRNSGPRISTNSKLIISLALSDSVILVAILLHHLLYILSTSSECEELIRRLILDMGLLTTLMNLLAMAIDHYLAIVRPIVHNYMMTNFQAVCFVIGIWVFSASGCLLEILIGYILMDQGKEQLCHVVSYDEFDLEIFIVGFIFVALLGIAYLYITIYIKIQTKTSEPRHFQRSVHGSKSFVTTVLLIGTFVIFWMPHGIFQVYIFFMNKQELFRRIQEIIKVNHILFFILQLNSLADPLIYAIRLPKIRAGYKAICFKGGRQRTESTDSNNQTESTIPLYYIV